MRTLYTVEYAKQTSFTSTAYKFVVADSFNDVLIWFEANHVEQLVSVKQTFHSVIVLPEKVEIQAFMES